MVKHIVPDTMSRVHATSAINTVGELTYSLRGNQINSGGAVAATVNLIIDCNVFFFCDYCSSVPTNAHDPVCTSSCLQVITMLDNAWFAMQNERLFGLLVWFSGHLD